MLLIDADDLWLDIMMLPHNGDMISSEEVEQAIEDAPTIDPESLRPKGEWIEAEDGDGVICSVCREDFCTIIHETDKFNFCPSCGADMRGET